MDKTQHEITNNTWKYNVTQTHNKLYFEVYYSYCMQ